MRTIWLPVAVNRGEIQQVLLNLILNAEQAMHTANARGRLLLRTPHQTRHITIDVEDDGPGISPAIAGQIFEPFFSTKEVGQGTGLGLSIALGIAEAHGGSLRACKNEDRLLLSPYASGRARCCRRRRRASCAAV